MTVSVCRKQTRPPDAGNNLCKSHFIMCHVTKYSMIRGVFQQPWPGVSPTAIFNEERALGTRLLAPRVVSPPRDELVILMFAPCNRIHRGIGFRIPTLWIPDSYSLDSGFQFSRFQMPTIWIPIFPILVSTYVCSSVTSYLNRFLSATIQ